MALFIWIFYVQHIFEGTMPSQRGLEAKDEKGHLKAPVSTCRCRCCLRWFTADIAITNSTICLEGIPKLPNLRCCPSRQPQELLHAMFHTPIGASIARVRKFILWDRGRQRLCRTEQAPSIS